jgi:hypothetical protein
MGSQPGEEPDEPDTGQGPQADDGSSSRPGSKSPGAFHVAKETSQMRGSDADGLSDSERLRGPPPSVLSDAARYQWVSQKERKRR